MVSSLAQVEPPLANLHARRNCRLDKAPSRLVVALRKTWLKCKPEWQLRLHPADAQLVAVPDVGCLQARDEEFVLVGLAWFLVERGKVPCMQNMCGTVT